MDPLIRSYYLLKPMLPRAARASLRRWHASRIRQRCGDTWPIQVTAGAKPEGWRGWPDGHRFAFVLTHDVENRVGYSRVRHLAEVDQAGGFRSSFNFIPRGDYVVDAELRGWLARAGFEVGVHDLHHDGKLFTSRETFREKARDINQHLKEWGAVGFRSGFMIHRLDWLHDLDVLYDASTFDTDPFEPQPDGVGTIFPFWVQHPSGRGYVELPYTLAQDSTLFLFLGERSTELWKRKLDWIVERGGMALVNVHPDYVAFDGRPMSGEFPVELYREFLDYVRTRYQGQYWAALPSEVAGWYKRECVERGTVATNGQPTCRPSSINSAGVDGRLHGKRAAVVVFSYFPSDPRPRREALSLAKAGMTVDYFCLRDGPSVPTRETRDGINVFRMPITRQRSKWSRYVTQYLGFLVMVGAMLSWRSLRRRYDLVHVHNMPDFLTFTAVIAKLRGARVVLDLHDPMPEVFQSIFRGGERHPAVRLLKLQERLSIAFADLAITPNIAFKERFVSRGCPPEKMNIVMNSPQEDVFGALADPPPPTRDPNAPFRLMYHGSLVDRHGLDTAVEAVAVLRERMPNLFFNIYGYPTPYVDEIMAMVKARQLEAVVRYHGPRSLDEIARLIGEADLGIVPNRRTVFTEINMPTRVFEFLAKGRPVIAPNTRGIRDYFKEDEMIFFEPSSAEDLARQILWVYEHPDATRQIVLRGQRIYAQHRWKDEERFFRKIIRELLP